MTETCFNYTMDTAYFSSTEQKWIARIHKLQKTYPNDVTIIAEPKNNNGCIYCKVPSAWLQIKPPIKLNLSDEERALRKQRALNNFHVESTEK